jgi:hypothetical protein
MEFDYFSYGFFEFGDAIFYIVGIRLILQEVASASYEFGLKCLCHLSLGKQHILVVCQVALVLFHLISIA